MSYLVWRKDVEIWLTAAILTVICPVSRCANNSNASSLSHMPFPNEPMCHILLAGDALLLRCHFDRDCERWWCHKDPGTTAYLILPEGDFLGVSIFTRMYAKPGSSISRDKNQKRTESVLMVERTSIPDAGQYMCVCAASNLSYKIDIAVVNVSARVKPKCNRRVELTFEGMVEPIDLTIYKWICRPYAARLIEETIIHNTKRLEIELDIEADTSSRVACYFYLKSHNETMSCGVRVIPVAFQIHTKGDTCNIDFLEASAADSMTFSPDGFRWTFLLLTFLLTFIIGQGRLQEDADFTRLIQLHSFDLG